MLFKFLTCTLTRKRLLGRPGLRWEGNRSREMVVNKENWIDMTLDKDY